MAAHGIVMIEDVLVDLFTNEKAAIPEGMLFTVINQFRDCACFFIELILVGEPNKSITAEVQHNLKYRFLLF